MFTSSLIKFRNGVRASFNVGMIFGAGSDARWDRLYIRGSKGCISSAVEYNQAGELKYTIISEGKTIEQVVDVRQNYALETEQLGRCIEKNETQHVTPEFSIKNAELMDMVFEKIGY